MVELATKIRTPVEHDCAANTDCDGVQCVAELLLQTYLMEFLILSCEDPPAVDILVEDTDGNPVYAVIVNNTYSDILYFEDLQIYLQVTVVHYNYSMDVQVSIGPTVYTSICIS